MTKPGLLIPQRVALHSVLGERGCELWVGSRNTQGYGRIGIKGKCTLVHRAIWEYTYGPIPKALEIDHLCRQRACVNIRHMELVTHAENISRGMSGVWQRAKTHCPQGHPYDLVNTLYKGASRLCRTCVRASALRRYYATKVTPAWVGTPSACEWCWRLYKLTRPWQRFCSHGCKETARATRRPKERNGKSVHS